MQEVLLVIPSVFVYLDDIFLMSQTEQEHRILLHRVFERLKLHGLTVNSNKCILGVSSLQFLVHHVSEKGLQLSQSNVTAIVEYERPRTRKQLLTFPGIVQFYSRFVEHLAELLNPLHALTRTGHARFTWTMEAEYSFVEVERRLANATILAHPSDSSDIELVTDASEVAMGAVLNQIIGEVRHPLEFWSKTLNAFEQKWSYYKRLLGHQTFSLFS